MQTPIKLLLIPVFSINDTTNIKDFNILLRLFIKKIQVLEILALSKCGKAFFRPHCNGCCDFRKVFYYGTKKGQPICRIVVVFTFLQQYTQMYEVRYSHFRTKHHRAENRRFSIFKRTKTDDTQPKLNVVCFVVQSCLTDADFVISSNYCLIGTRESPPSFYRCRRIFCRLQMS